MKNKLLPAILLGAAVGGLVSLIDKNTRESVIQGSKKAIDYAKHPDELKNQFASNSSEPSKFEQIKEEVLFWKDTFEEIRRNNPELEESLKNAKAIFDKNKDQKHLQ
ncbi:MULTISPECIES: hypothetical protein [Nosocomiicoccus]|uniref:hypothetical protein n=1 Tax=Nosocomiicoccus TaxID=489909 RepID=UPI0008A1368E|nr:MULTISPECIES: hypothetical protein [Nosocomiicoccus]MDK6863896.1 YtxH domain-containing protein [Nosocomiicoccus ampullae]OFL48698.1 hypothetical protein HMPREF2767_07340 [Nosocomiicoccus sp. HMSC067E10]